MNYLLLLSLVLLLFHTPLFQCRVVCHNHTRQLPTLNTPTDSESNTEMDKITNEEV